MTLPHGYLYVDPDGVGRLGAEYTEHKQLYDQHLDQLASIRERYADAWGHDATGKQFEHPYNDQMDGVGEQIRGQRDTLGFTGETLGSQGKNYQRTDEDAADAGHRLASSFESDLTPVRAVSDTPASSNRLIDRVPEGHTEPSQRMIDVAPEGKEQPGQRMIDLAPEGKELPTQRRIDTAPEGTPVE